MTLKEKQQRLSKMIADGKALQAELEAVVKDGGEPEAEKQANLQQMIADGMKLRAEIEQEMQLDDLDAFANKPANERASKRGAAVEERKTWGEIVTASEQFAAAMKRGETGRLDRVRVGGFTAKTGRETKALHTTTEAAGGALIEAMREAGIISIARRPRSLMNLVTVMPVSTNTVEWVSQLARTNNAAPTVEWTGAAFGLKPESNITFQVQQTAVQTIPTWIPASRNVLADAPMLQAMIEDELAYMIEVVLEDQMLNGDGNAPNLEGILQTAGIQTRTQGDIADRGGEASDTIADAIRRALTDIALEYYNADAVVMNPADGEALELLKDTNGNYLAMYDSAQGRIWRVPVVESQVITAGTVLVGNFRMGATLYDRQQTDIRVGEPDDYFLRNAVAILAELRAAFAVKRPAAFEAITLA